MSAERFINRILQLARPGCHLVNTELLTTRLRPTRFLYLSSAHNATCLEVKSSNWSSAARIDNCRVGSEPDYMYALCSLPVTTVVRPCEPYSAPTRSVGE